MNDLDLRAALHRDADLAGEPSPDLLDQLVRRRVYQRRRRTAVLATVAGVVVVGAGVPVGQSFLTSSETQPATQTTVEPTPSPSTTPSVSPETPPPAVTPAPTTPETATVSTPPASVPRPCLDSATARALLPPDGEQGGFYVMDAGGPECAGTWAAVVAGHGVDGKVMTHSTYIFEWVGNGWQRPARDRGELCTSGDIPQALYPLACGTN